MALHQHLFYTACPPAFRIFLFEIGHVLVYQLQHVLHITGDLALNQILHVKQSPNVKGNLSSRM